MRRRPLLLISGEYIMPHKKNLSLRSKIFLTSIAVGFFIAIAFLLISRYIVNRVVVHRSNIFFQETVNQIGMRVDLQIQNANKKADMIANGQLLKNYMKDLKYGEINYNIVKYSIMRNVIKLIDLDGIDGIYIFPEGKPTINCYYAEPQLMESDSDAFALKQMLENSDLQKLWVIEPDHQKFSQYRTIRQKDDFYGIVQIRYHIDMFWNVLDPAANNLEGIFFISDENEDILISSFPSQIGMNTADLTWDSDLILTYPLIGETWKLTGVIVKDGIMEQVQIVLFLFGGVFVLIVCVIGAYVGLTFRYIQYPLKKILRGFESIAMGNLDTRLENNVETEFGFLIDHFNHTAERIQELIRQVYHQEVNYRKAEISALQGKLNPHFLYNVLDIIYWRVLIRDDEKTADILVALSDILRYSISQGNEFVFLSEDIRHTESYLKIQQALHENRLQYNFDIDKELESIWVPKLIMQPVIENAIKHGFAGRDEVLHISIQGKSCGEDIVFSIEDDGAGMSKETVEAVLAAVNGEMAKDSGMGLQLVHKRLEHTYGNGYGIEIDSVQNKGTEVRLRLKWSTEINLQENLNPRGEGYA